MKHAQRVSSKLLLILIVTTIVSTQLSKALANDLITCQLDSKLMNTRNKVFLYLGKFQHSKIVHKLWYYPSIRP